MSCGAQLRALLEPLGVYRWEGSFQWGELKSAGAALDGVGEALALLRREMNPATAQEEGLTLLSALLSREYAGLDGEGLRDCLTALLRVNGGCFTLAAANDALKGCGIPAQVEEGPGALALTVYFPNHSAPPENWALVRGLIEDVLPCHLEIHYRFRVVTWEGVEAAYPSWAALEGAGLAWGDFGEP